MQYGFFRGLLGVALALLQLLLATGLGEYDH